MRFSTALAAMLACASVGVSDGFHVQRCVHPLATTKPSSASASASSTTALFSSRGMGMTAKPKSSNKKKGGKKKSSSASFDASASMKSLEKKYDTLLLNQSKQLAREDPADSDNIWVEDIIGTSKPKKPEQAVVDHHTMEYVIAARSNAAASASKASVSDWIPIAQMCLARETSMVNENDTKPMITAAISTYCREFFHVAKFGAPVFGTIPRNDIEYSAEPLEEFYKHVYDAVIEGGSSSDKKSASDDNMSKSEARGHLGVADDCNDKSEIKTAYRKLAFELHSDRFEGTEEECAEAAERFNKVKIAYETLSSGVREEGSSWYASLGGRSRTSFFGPVALENIEASKSKLEAMKVQSAVVGLDPELVQSFVARNLRSQ